MLTKYLTTITWFQVVPRSSTLMSHINSTLFRHPRQQTFRRQDNRSSITVCYLNQMGTYSWVFFLIFNIDTFLILIVIRFNVSTTTWIFPRCSAEHDSEWHNTKQMISRLPSRVTLITTIHEFENVECEFGNNSSARTTTTTKKVLDLSPTQEWTLEVSRGHIWTLRQFYYSHL